MTLKIGFTILCSSLLVAVNCFGDVIDPHTGRIVAGVLDDTKKNFGDTMSIISTADSNGTDAFSSNTTIGCIAVNADFSKVEYRVQ